MGTLFNKELWPDFKKKGQLSVLIAFAGLVDSWLFIGLSAPKILNQDDLLDRGIVDQASVDARMANDADCATQSVQFAKDSQVNATD